MTAGLFVVEGRQGSSNAYFYPLPGTATQAKHHACAERLWGQSRKRGEAAGQPWLSAACHCHGQDQISREFHSCSFYGSLGIYSGIQMGSKEVQKQLLI